MPPDFTYEMYAALLATAREAGLRFLTVREYLDECDLPEGFVVARHDVDRKPGNALDFAHIEASRGIESTYYFRTVDTTFDREVIQEVESLGHEIGYHYEDLDRAGGDTVLARQTFERNLRRIRRVATVDTVCMHGNPLSSHDNRDIWGDDPDFERYDLLGEAYLSMDFTDVTYFSDTGRTWRDGVLKFDDTTVGDDAKSVQVDTTPELVTLLRRNPNGRYYLLTHPDRWTGGPIERVIETGYDAVKNAAKHVLQARRGLR